MIARRGSGPRAGGARRGVDRQGDEAFHVASATAEVGVAGVGELERIALPFRLVGRHHVHVAGEHQPVAGVSRLRAGGDHQIGLVAVRRGIALGAQSGTIQIIADEVGDRQIAVAAGAVESHQAAQQLGVGQDGAHPSILLWIHGPGSRVGLLDFGAEERNDSAELVA